MYYCTRERSYALLLMAFQDSSQVHTSALNFTCSVCFAAANSVHAEEMQADSHHAGSAHCQPQLSEGVAITQGNAAGCGCRAVFALQSALQRGPG